MGGIFRRLWQGFGFAFLILILIASPLVSNRVSAAGSLISLRDLISSTIFNSQGIEHDISFLVPPDADQVNPQDFIIITMPKFSNFTLPNELIGGFGNPIFSLSGHKVRVTNITLLPGTRLEILGIQATNPSTFEDFTVTVGIARGSASGLISNESTTYASDNSSAFDTVEATIQSPLASINISGFTSAGAFVTLNEGNITIGTTNGAGNGAFNFPISGLDPGNHTYQVSAVDGQGRSTSQTIVEMFLASGTVTSASGIILSSTIALDKAQIAPGDNLTISGSGMPSSQINIFTESPLRSYTVTSDTNGDFSYQLSKSETSAYSPGSYRAYTLVQDSFGNQSLASPTANFTVGSPNDLNNPDPACNISHGDLNCDTKTNLTDFSILLFHWHTNHKKADINHDAQVNLVDFSIMMYYFQRS